MNAERIAELRALEAAATPGPWSAANDWGGVYAANTHDPDDPYFIADISSNDTHAFLENAQFIAAARNALPEALDAIEAAMCAIALECLDGCSGSCRFHGACAADWIERAQERQRSQLLTAAARWREDLPEPIDTAHAVVTAVSMMRNNGVAPAEPDGTYRLELTQELYDRIMADPALSGAPKGVRIDKLWGCTIFLVKDGAPTGMVEARIP